MIVRRLAAALVAALVVCPPPILAATSAATPLDRFLKDLRTLRASFTQTLVDARGRTLDRASGTLVVSRPGKFRWEIQPTGADGEGQLLVADGRNLWFFDRDLEQVTVRPMDAALTATPAMLLSGTADVRDAFKVESTGRRDGLDWVRVVPRRSDADFREAEIGFARGDMRRMVLKDKLGQTATVVFERARRNGQVSPSEVSFTPPRTADVIGTPRA
ncbi:MAG: outer membrane lipoprotein chaperone LolA [Gammaproteobacteria bacterium]